MAIRRALFKAGVVGAKASRLVMFRFPCNRIEQLLALYRAPHQSIMTGALRMSLRTGFVKTYRAPPIFGVPYAA